ncbi:alpha/beta fold hydrolase [Pseudohoeflea suaedae]|uniref:Alpha/beta fold hydrolase n=1 Tax=Pseudohoeflea suaedae TaxID=877384 RepID=A0A4R5PK57_9HYPH|nr:alpha/beta fold hydrolase [Pseudohoeflea suaedae]TDH36006.1 alpha/beta fold hydrolase [Pseudohoeflea suaedae]
MSKWLLKSIGLIISIVAFFSPEAAGRFAFQLFARAPGPKPESEKEARVIREAGPRIRKAERVRLLLSDGAIVAAYDFGVRDEVSCRGKVLVVHGYRSRTEHMLPIIEALVAHDFHVIAIDMPGHGRSPSRRSHLVNAAEAIDAAWRQFDGFDVFIGHSFGAAAIVSVASGTVSTVPARRPYKLITIASPTRLRTIFDWFAEETGMRGAVRKAFEGEVMTLSGRPLDDYDAARGMAQIRSEVLVMHAPDDKEVPFSCAEALAATGPHVRLKPVPGYGHRRILAAPPVIEGILDFLGVRDFGDADAQLALIAKMDFGLVDKARTSA